MPAAPAPATPISATPSFLNHAVNGLANGSANGSLHAAAPAPVNGSAGHVNGFSAVRLAPPVIEAKPTNGTAIFDDHRTLEEIEREAILQTLARFNGHRQRTAQSLGIGVRTLGLKLKKWKQDRIIAETV